MWVPDQLLVKFQSTVQASEVQTLHQAAGGAVQRTIPHLGVHVVRLAQGTSAAVALAAYRASSLVQYAEQDAYGYLLATPNDTFYSLQWHYPQINLPAAWDITTGSPVVVAVLDSGIRAHPDLSGIAVQGFDFFDNDNDPTDPGCPSNPNSFSHGMHVTGTIAANTNNSTGVAGVNWGGVAGTRIMPIRVGGDVGGNCGTVLISAAASGLVYATDHGAKVVNMSFGGSVDVMTLRDAVTYASNNGLTLIAAAGNDNGPVGYPAAYANVIAVAATACNNARASYSNFGPQISVAAPGGDLVDCTGDGVAEFVLSTSWSPNAGNAYFYDLGTSMAAPHVSGVAALLISRGLTGAATIRNRLQTTATDLGTPGFDSFFGWGLVNAAAAVGVSVPASSLRAFTGLLSGSTIMVQSDIVAVAGSGTFLVTNAQSGVRSLFAWQDFNGNAILDAGDMFGRVDNVTINPGATTSGVNVIVQRYSGGPISVSGTSSTRTR